MLLDTGGPLKWDDQGTDIIIVDVDVYVYEIQRNTYEGCLTQSSTMGLITTWDHTVDLFYVVGFKVNHRQEIVELLVIWCGDISGCQVLD